jgi:hypothetical protein
MARRRGRLGQRDSGIGHAALGGVFHKSPIAAALLGLVAAQQCLAAPPANTIPSAGTVLQNAPQLPAQPVTTIPELRVQRAPVAPASTDSTQIPVSFVEY